MIIARTSALHRKTTSHRLSLTRSRLIRKAPHNALAITIDIRWAVGSSPSATYRAPRQSLDRSVQASNRTQSNHTSPAASLRQLQAHKTTRRSRRLPSGATPLSNISSNSNRTTNRTIQGSTARPVNAHQSRTTVTSSSSWPTRAPQPVVLTSIISSSSMCL